MKSIGLSDEVYELLLRYKHTLERARGEVISYDRVIRYMLELGGDGEKKNEDKD